MYVYVHFHVIFFISDLTHPESSKKVLIMELTQ